MPRIPPWHPVGILFVGSGGVAETHSKTLSRKGFKVRLHFTDREPLLARKADEQFKGAGWFDSVDAALRSDSVQAVVVATPPDSHLELTLKALEHEKHVIVEKPAFLRPEDFNTVARAARNAERQVFVAENYFYKPLASRLREIIATEALGEIRFIAVNALKHQPFEGWRSEPERAGGGVLFEGGIHWINLLANLGLEIVEASGVRAGPTEGPEKSVVVTFKYSGGAIGTLHYSWELPAPFKGLRVSRIYGTGGHFAFESNGLWTFMRRYGGLGLASLPRLAFPGVVDLMGYRAMFSDFLNAIRTETEPKFTLSMARRDVELAREVYRTL
jgi:predicted dehydrogenase